MMVATLSPMPNVQVVVRDSLFPAASLGDFAGTRYDVAADGRSFLMVSTVEEHIRLVIALDRATGVGARERANCA